MMTTDDNASFDDGHARVRSTARRMRRRRALALARAPVTPASHGKVNVSFLINAPAQSSTSQSAAVIPSGAQRSRGTATGVKPQYLSPATQSITVDITGPTDITETQNLTVNPSGCTGSLASVICTLTVALAPCTDPPTNCYTASLTTYAQTGGAGNVLSSAQSIVFTVASGQNNSVNLSL